MNEPIWSAFDEEMQRRLDEGICRWCGIHPAPEWGAKCRQCEIEDNETEHNR